MRLSKKMLDPEKPQLGVIDRWYHPGCFVNNREELGFCAEYTASQLKGFSLLTAEDKEALKKHLPGVKSEGCVEGHGKHGLAQQGSRWRCRDQWVTHHPCVPLIMVRKPGGADLGVVTAELCCFPAWLGGQGREGCRAVPECVSEAPGWSSPLHGTSPWAGVSSIAPARTFQANALCQEIMGVLTSDEA